MGSVYIDISRYLWSYLKKLRNSDLGGICLTHSVKLSVSNISQETVRVTITGNVANAQKAHANIKVLASKSKPGILQCIETLEDEVDKEELDKALEDTYGYVMYRRNDNIHIIGSPEYIPIGKTMACELISQLSVEIEHDHYENSMELMEVNRRTPSPPNQTSNQPNQLSSDDTSSNISMSSDSAINPVEATGSVVNSEDGHGNQNGIQQNEEAPLITLDNQPMRAMEVPACGQGSQSMNDVREAPASVRPKVKQVTARQQPQPVLRLTPHGNINASLQPSNSGAQPQEHIKPGRWFRYRDTELKVQLLVDDITKVKADAIVNASNCHLKPGGGITKAITDAAGPMLEKDCSDYIQQHGQLQVCETFVSKGYQLPCRFVIHVVGPMFGEGGDKHAFAQTLYRSFFNCFNDAEAREVNSIAIPAVSSGFLGGPMPIVTGTVYQAVKIFLRGAKHVKTIHLIDISQTFIEEVTEKFNNGKGDGFYEIPAQVQSGPRMHESAKEEPQSPQTMPYPMPPAMFEKERCSICQEEPTGPCTLACNHTFCKECIIEWFKTKKKCPLCGAEGGVVKGDQPRGGLMKWDFIKDKKLQGYPGSRGIIQITYTFPAGNQSAEHPAPGKPYAGAEYKAYLPDIPEGREMFELLKRAFNARLIFTIEPPDDLDGTSGKLAWNGILHKTSCTGGAENSGYPDPTYLPRLKQELSVKGIY